MKLQAVNGEQAVDIVVERDDADNFIVTVNDRTYHVDARKLEGDFYSILDDGRSYEVVVEIDGDDYRVRRGADERHVRISDPLRRGRGPGEAPPGPENIVSQMPGKVVRVLVAAGDEIEAGQGVVVVEAMKMENEIAASKAGTVASIEIEEGQAVEGGTLLAVIE